MTPEKIIEAIQTINEVEPELKADIFRLNS